ncbi:hypothetical protein WJX84_009859 [Apatococcus fuscideae]|uniref:Prefoldin subunit 6 n=1 Tax=Apatococcus fuscideae TaxID=2026836 RepID=A0AAW1SW39_9CHLO
MADPKLKALEQSLQAEADGLKSLEREGQRAQQAQQQFIQQQNENQMVLKELETLEDDNGVYKLVGPVLIKQDLVEARSNVKKRLELISGELSRIDSQLKNLSKEGQRKQQQGMKLQQELQRLQQSSRQ